MSHSPSARDLDFGGAEHRLRGWLLFVLEGFGRYGLAPVAQDRLHLLLYFAAVLSPVYRLETPVLKILKHRTVPFYPEAQFALERLVVSRHVINAGRESVRDDGSAWDAYRISEAGLATAGLLATTAWGRRVSRFSHDLVQGFARLDPEMADAIVQQDAFFRDGRMDVDEVKTVTPGNEAVATLRWVAEDEDESPHNERDSVLLYFTYLQARMAA